MNHRLKKGHEILNILNPGGAAKVREYLADIAPDMGGFIVEFAYGDVYRVDALDMKSRQVATMAALTALGNAAPQLEWHMDAGLNIGITPREIVEIIYITTVYAGFPAGLNGLAAAREVFASRKIDVEPTRQYQGDNRRVRGLAAMNATSRDSGEKVVRDLADMAPDMADFIIDFAYGDIIHRTGLPPRFKEIAAIACMCATGTMQPQLKVHIRAALNVGCSRSEIVEVLQQMAVYAGFPAAINGIAAAREVFHPTELSNKELTD